MGMRAKALFSTASWIDVTPAVEASSSHVPEADERAWKRDIEKFLKKASSHKTLRRHVVRETDVLRIPAVASDGYFRVVLCSGTESKKVLCPSPVFRIASTSVDMSILRGANLKTMPLEVGLKIASIVGQRAAGNLVSPVTGAIQGQAQKYQPDFVTKQAGQLAYNRSGLENKVDTAQQHYGQSRDATYEVLEGGEIFDSPPEVVGADSGPVKPFPISFDAKVVRGTGRGTSEFGVPTANLSGVPEDLLYRLSGIYIGWVVVMPGKNLEGLSHDWHESIISFGPSPYADPTIVVKNVATAHIIHDFGDASFFDAKVKVMILAYLRPTPTSGKLRETEDVVEAVVRDTAIAIASLSRECWGPDMVINRSKTEKSNRTLSERYVDARTEVQKQVDRVPLRWVGVRTTGEVLRDRVHGNGGLYILR
jgi:hypothetical protein